MQQQSESVKNRIRHYLGVSLAQVSFVFISSFSSSSFPIIFCSAAALDLTLLHPRDVLQDRVEERGADFRIIANLKPELDAAA
jgi:hypothetical protein